MTFDARKSEKPMRTASRRFLAATLFALLSLGRGYPANAADEPSAPIYEIGIEEAWIPLPDGVRLAADLFVPRGGATGERFPVLLEYLPYRKAESRSRNYSLYSYFVRRGYVVARVDIRGTGNSEGRLIAYEYTDRENEDGEVVMCESGAIVEYILERYGAGRLAPPIGSPARAAFLQWLHFAESTAFPPLGIIVWLTRYRGDAEQQAALLEDARTRAEAGLDFLQRGLGSKRFLLGDGFSAADVMMGFTLAAARALGVLDDRHPVLNEYLARLQARPAFQKAAALA